MHAVGFWHEQSRADRDNHVTIVKSNIQDGMLFNFDKYTWDLIQHLSESYDTGEQLFKMPFNNKKREKVRESLFNGR